MARRLVCTPSSVSFNVQSRSIVFLVWLLCSCLVVLGVFFAINAEVGVSNSSYTISVVASVVVFVVFLLTACFCAPLTFSTEFEADAVRKVITFHASVLGCISWRSMCSACKFQDVQDVVIKPAGIDKHRVELHLKQTFGGPETNRVIYVTDEIPCEDEAACDAFRKSLCSWLSCCLGLSENSVEDVGDDAKNASHENSNDESRHASVADDGASQHSKRSQKVPSPAQPAAPLPPAHLVVETVNELNRVLDSVKEQQKQSDYAVARIAEVSTGVSNPPAADRTTTQAGIALPDVPRPKGPNSIRPRLPASLSASFSLPSDASSFADESDLSPWGSLGAFEGASSERAAQNRFASASDRVSVAGGSFRGGSLSGNAFAAVGIGSVSSFNQSVSSESSRPVFHRRAPTAARNSPAAVATDPSLLSSAAAVSLVRPPVALAPVTLPLALRQELFVVPFAPSPLASTSRGVVSSANEMTPTRNVTHNVSATAAPFASVAVDRLPLQDASVEWNAPRHAVVPSEALVPVANGRSAVHYASVISTPSLHGPSVTSQAAAAPSSRVMDAASATRVLSPLQDGADTKNAPETTNIPVVASDIAVLERILISISAANLLARFVDDGMDDGDLGALAATKPAKLMAKYGLHESQIRAFITGCQQAGSGQDAQLHSAAALHGQQFRQAPFEEANLNSSASDFAANVQTLAPQQHIARPLTAILADAQAPRARPPLPPLPPSFEN